MLFVCSISLALAALSFAQDTNVQTVESSLMMAQVIPDVLPSNFTPAFPIEVAFTDPTTSQVIPVTAGMNLTMSQTMNVPNFAILSTNTQIIGKPYLMIIVDPDAPNPPGNVSEAQVIQFLGINYVSNMLTNGTLFILANNSAPIVPYSPPTPPAGSAPHRYVVAMYLQATNNVTIMPGSVPANRTNFNLTTFAQETSGLTLLGATFFFVGPGNTTSTNSGTSGNGSASSAPGSASATAPSTSGSATSGAGNTGAALELQVVAPAIWSVLAALFGAVIYFA